jgi:hypothetical protein
VCGGVVVADWMMLTLAENLPGLKALRNSENFFAGILFDGVWKVHFFATKAPKHQVSPIPAIRDKDNSVKTSFFRESL